MSEMGRAEGQSGSTSGDVGKVRMAILIAWVLTLGLVSWLWFELAGSESVPEASSSSSTRVSTSAEAAERGEVILPIVSAEATPKDLDGEKLLEPSAPTTADPTGDDSIFVQSPKHVERPWNPHRSYVDKQFFEARYADASLGELMEAKIRIAAEVATQTKEATQKFFEAGRAEETRRNREEAIATPQKNVTANTGLIMTTQAEVTSTGDVINRTAELPWIEYTDLYDLQDEMFWLLWEINRRSNADSP